MRCPFKKYLRDEETYNHIVCTVKFLFSAGIQQDRHRPITKMNELMSVSKSGLLILGCHGNGFYSFWIFFTHIPFHDYTKKMNGLKHVKKNSRTLFTGFLSGITSTSVEFY